MKLKVFWPERSRTDDSIIEHEIIHSDNFNIDLEDIGVLDTIQEAVDYYETGTDNCGGFCIDQGGDDDYYEFDFSDIGCLDKTQEEIMKVAQEFLNYVATSLREVKVNQ